MFKKRTLTTKQSITYDQDQDRAPDSFAKSPMCLTNNIEKQKIHGQIPDTPDIQCKLYRST